MRASLVLATVLAITLGACAPAPSGSADSAREVTITLSEFKFTAASFELQAGAPIRLTVKNAGAVDHDFTVQQLGVAVPVKPGASATKDLGTVAAGIYDIVCTIPGHKEAGMVGKLTVK